MKIFEMMKGAKTLVRNCANVVPQETVLIVADSSMPFSITQAIALAARAEGAETEIMIISPRKYHNEEPPKTAAAAMKAADVVFEVSSKGFYHTDARKEANEAGARYITLCELTEDLMVSGPMEADYVKIKPTVDKLAKKLETGKIMRVTSPAGTDFTADITGRPGRALSGVVHNRGDFGAPPDIEASVTPLEGTANGILYVDAYGVDVGPISEPVKITFEAGMAVKIEGGPEAKKLRDRLASANDPKIYNFAEFGIGLNPLCGMSPCLLDTEGKAGTAHVALGSSPVGSGGTVKASAHLDQVFWKPTIEVDGELLLKDGEVVFD
jgi:2,5-dihydroxypyridine 5,6-dioxygenase